MVFRIGQDKVFGQVDPVDRDIQLLRHDAIDTGQQDRVAPPGLQYFADIRVLRVVVIAGVARKPVRIINDVVQQIVNQERAAREAIIKTSGVQLEDKIYRSLGVLMNSRIIETKEAAQCLSDVRLGIDIGYIKNISRNILNELMILTQPGFLQLYAGGGLRPFERDVRRATMIRERLQMENNN